MPNEHIVVATIGDEPRVLTSVLWGLQNLGLVRPGDCCKAIVVTTWQGYVNLCGRGGSQFDLAGEIYNMVEVYARDGGVDWRELQQIELPESLNNCVPAEFDQCPVQQAGFAVRVPRTNGVFLEDLNTSDDLTAMSDLILHMVQAVNAAAGTDEQGTRPQIHYAISGGRKNMSALLKECAGWFASLRDTALHVFPPVDNSHASFPLPDQQDNWVAQLQPIPLLESTSKGLFDKASKLFDTDAASVTYEQLLKTQRFYALGGFDQCKHKPEVTIRIIRDIDLMPNSDAPYTADFRLEFDISYHDPWVDGNRVETSRKLPLSDLQDGLHRLSRKWCKGLILLILLHARRKAGVERPWVDGVPAWDEAGVTDLLIMQRAVRWLYAYDWIHSAGDPNVFTALFEDNQQTLSSLCARRKLAMSRSSYEHANDDAWPILWTEPLTENQRHTYKGIGPKNFHTALSRTAFCAQNRPDVIQDLFLDENAVVKGHLEGQGDDGYFSFSLVASNFFKKLVAEEAFGLVDLDQPLVGKESRCTLCPDLDDEAVAQLGEFFDQHRESRFTVQYYEFDPSDKKSLPPELYDDNIHTYDGTDLIGKPDTLKKLRGLLFSRGKNVRGSAKRAFIGMRGSDREDKVFFPVTGTGYYLPGNISVEVQDCVHAGGEKRARTLHAADFADISEEKKENCRDAAKQFIEEEVELDGTARIFLHGALGGD